MALVQWCCGASYFLVAMNVIQELTAPTEINPVKIWKVCRVERVKVISLVK